VSTEVYSNVDLYSAIRISNALTWIEPWRIMLSMGMAEEARRAAEQYRTAEQQHAVSVGQTEAWLRQTIDRLAAEFAESARSMGIKPAKRKFAKLMEPAYFSVHLVVMPPGGDQHGSSWRIRVRRNGSWDFGAGNHRPFFPVSLPQNPEQQLRESFTRALSDRARGVPESPTR